jgi:hypothetical protein
MAGDPAAYQRRCDRGGYREPHVRGAEHWQPPFVQASFA